MPNVLFSWFGTAPKALFHSASSKRRDANLQAAESVSALAVDPPRGKRGEGAIPSADICHHLARHGVHAEAASSVAEDIDIGSFLLSHAADRGVDMIVMGAYGHSRLGEMMLGGVTKSMLQHMTVPVFMSH